jgi:hypothetical protein
MLVVVVSGNISLSLFLEQFFLFVHCKRTG